jgi:hypothetical protein
MVALFAVLGVAAALAIGVGVLFYADRREQERLKDLGHPRS